MIKCITSKALPAFYLICLSAAIALSIYWVYVFTLNEDLITIDYIKYYQREKDAFPSLSLCLETQISKEKLLKVSPGTNASSYVEFLKGNIFDPNMLLIDYFAVIENLSDYIEEDWINYRNGSFIPLHPEYYGTKFDSYGNNVKKNKRKFPFNYVFYYSEFDQFYNCYEISAPHDENINSFYIRVNSSIFPSGIRPLNHGFMILIHYPNQMLITSNRNNRWPQERNMTDSYTMNFYIRGAEVLRRRQKRDRPCNENWEQHDSDIKKHFATTLGCRPPYLEKVEGIPLCSTKEQMKKRFNFRQDGYGVNPPCREMKKILSSFEENTWDPELSWVRKGIFWIVIFFSDEDFKEISQTR